VQTLIDSALIERSRNVRAAPFLSRALSHVTAAGRHQRLLDEVLRQAARLVGANADLIRERVRAETPWWFPDLADEMIHVKIVPAIKRTLDAVSADPEHPLHRRMNAALERAIARLQDAPEVMARVDALKDAALDHPILREFLQSLWVDAKRAMLSVAERRIGIPACRKSHAACSRSRARYSPIRRWSRSSTGGCTTPSWDWSSSIARKSATSSPKPSAPGTAPRLREKSSCRSAATCNSCASTAPSSGDWSV
jgi:hypothetical protein